MHRTPLDCHKLVHNAMIATAQASPAVPKIRATDIAQCIGNQARTSVRSHFLATFNPCSAPSRSINFNPLLRQNHFCPACGESITDMVETDRVMRAMRAYSAQVKKLPNLAEFEKASPASDRVKRIVDLESILKPRPLAVILAEIEAKARARFGAPPGTEGP